MILIGNGVKDLHNFVCVMQIEYPDHTGWVTVDEKQYNLKQMHWHSPSEHRINGDRFSLYLSQRVRWQNWSGPLSGLATSASGHLLGRSIFQWSGPTRPGSKSIRGSLAREGILIPFS